MGQVYTTWNNSNAVYTDVSSPDLNGSTSNFVWKVQVNGGTGDVELVAVISGDTWDILVSTRIVF
jgi:hypothetical protein